MILGAAKEVAKVVGEVPEGEVRGGEESHGNGFPATEIGSLRSHLSEVQGIEAEVLKGLFRKPLGDEGPQKGVDLVLFFFFLRESSHRRLVLLEVLGGGEGAPR